MPDDPSDTSPAAENFSSPKKETVRITLPPQQEEETPLIKRETVRIPTPGGLPKKETTSLGAPTPLSGMGGATPLPSISAPEPPLPSATRPLVAPPAPPPRPPAAPSVPPMGSKPSVPPVVPRPSAPAAPKAAYEAKPVTMKAAPKKETARIQVSPTQKLPPQATVRLTQPSAQLTTGPAPSIRTQAPPAATEVVTGQDTIALALSWAAVALSAIAAVFGYLAWSA